MKKYKSYWVFWILGIMCSCINTMKNSEEEAVLEVSGLNCISSNYFPVSKDAVDLKFPNGDMRQVQNGWPTGGWCIPDGSHIAKAFSALAEYNQRLPKPAEIAYAMGVTLGEYDFVYSRLNSQQLASPWADPSCADSMVRFMSEADALGINPYMHLDAGKTALLRSPNFSVQGNKPHFMALWVRSDISEISPEFYFWYDIGLEEISLNYFTLPNTNQEWKRVGVYFRAPADAKKAHFTLYFSGLQNEYIDIADIRLYTVSEEEYSKAYQNERKKFPVYQPSVTLDDGKYLTSSVAKLEGKLGIPGKPFLIWAVGSSYTNFLDDLEPIRQSIRERFPDAPEIIYKKHVGSACPYDFARGWIHTQVLAEQPDLILSYTEGDLRALEEMLKDIRQHSTADIIIPSLHLRQFDQLTSECINLPYYEEMRAICEKYKAQFVDNREALGSWLIRNNRPISDLLSDEVHQNNNGRLFICENIAQHFVKNLSPAYEAGDYEENISLVKAFITHDPRFIFSGEWQVGKDNLLESLTPQASIRMSFEGNRVDLVGCSISEGDEIEIFVDSIKAKKNPAYFISVVNPAITNIAHTGHFPRSSKENGDTGPHGVWLGKNVIPQQWKIEMIDNEGNYELTGSVTGKDGIGNRLKKFVSNSGQIIVDPSIWRNPDANVKGDYWMFEVYHCATDVIRSNPSNGSGMYSVPLIQNLPNGNHVIELRTNNRHKVAIESLYVFKPMLR